METNLRDDLLRIQEESEWQALPEQKKLFLVSEKINKRVHIVSFINCHNKMSKGEILEHQSTSKKYTIIADD